LAAPDPDWPKEVRDAALEEARRLFNVGITRVKSDLANGRLGNLFTSYPQR
jgi:superfamily I DNA/RNA helicase